MQRLKANRSGCVHDAEKFKDLRRRTKQFISQKNKEYATKLRDSVTENPKRFWSFVKSSRSVKITANFLRDNQSFITDSRDKANLLTQPAKRRRNNVETTLEDVVESTSKKG